MFYGIHTNIIKDLSHPSRTNWHEKIENGDVGVCISIANNGDPLTKAVASEKIYTWGVSSNGTGIGAYEVKGIIEAAGGSVDFESNPNEKSGYCVKYKLMLPLIRL